MASNKKQTSLPKPRSKPTRPRQQVVPHRGTSASTMPKRAAARPTGSDRAALRTSARVRTSSRAQMVNFRQDRTDQSRNRPLRSVRVGDVRSSTQKRRSQGGGHHVRRLGVLVAIVVVLAGGGIALYYSNLFTIDGVAVKGVSHLTSQDMQQLAGVPDGTTLLRVDTSSIKQSLLKDAWVKDVAVHRVFPHTLELDVTERSIMAVVEVPTTNAKSFVPWAIASDGMWLMPIPAQDSKEGRLTSPQVYTDAAQVLHITDVPYSTKPVVGAYCTDASIKNALDIVTGMTTELASRVTAVKATEPESTTLTIKDGPDIVFGTADDIREKERVCLEIMKQHPEGVAYINVRTVDRPTWRAL